MLLYARVNILEGKAVRLPRGDVADAIFLDANPVGRAVSWVALGADRLHVVDLDAAAFGDHRNADLIRDVISAVDVPVQVGGGARSPHEVERLLGAGADSVVLGTMPIVDQVLFWDVCRDHPGKIVVSLDVRPDEEIAIEGWQTNSGMYLEEALIEMSSAGAAGFMIAEVGRDALQEPPNFDALVRTLSIVEEPVVAAGGVRNMDDLATLKTLGSNGRSLSGVVVGREVTQGRFTIEEAAALVQGDTEAGPWSFEELQANLVRYREESGEATDTTGTEAFFAWLEKG